jgi:GTP-binding protein
LDLISDEIEAAGRSPAEVAEEVQGEPIRVAVVGRPNVGKSSLVNALVGSERAITSEVPGTTRDAVDTELVRDRDRYVLVDTAGIRRRGKVQGSFEFYCVLRAEKAIQRAHVACVVLDASEGLTDGDKRIAGLVKDSGTGCVMAANKWDLVERASPGKDSQARQDEFAQMVHTKMPYAAFAPVCCCSAREARGTERILDLAKTAADNRSLRIQTSDLNRLVRDAAAARPYSRKGKQLKIKYATMARVRPPTIVLFVNDRTIVHFSYLRYLENKVRSEYGYVGTPIRLFVRESEGEHRADGD